VVKKRKTRPAPADASTPAPDWSTPADRVKWLLETRFRGNRSAFAEAVDFSHTIIGKVAAGQAPGRKLLTAIAQSLSVNATWLLTGAGQPYHSSPDLGGRPGLPLSRHLLPGPPLEHQGLLSGEWLAAPGPLFTSSQYWLALASSQPLVREPSLGFRVNDRLLMESDRSSFPRERTLLGDLCVVHFRAGEPALKLGAVTFFEADEEGPERLELDAYDLDPDPSRLGEEVVYRHYPGGEIRLKKRPFKLVPFRGVERAVPLTGDEFEPALPTIRYGDIVAVWLQILFRPRSTPM
jgi:hypothetical protein